MVTIAAVGETIINTQVSAKTNMESATMFTSGIMTWPTNLCAESKAFLTSSAEFRCVWKR